MSNLREVDLNEWARKFVKGAVHGKYLRDNDYDIDLEKHRFPDGRTYFEFVQGEKIYTVGATIFLALKDNSGEIVQDSLWDESDMQ